MKKVPKSLVLAFFTILMIILTGCKKDAENPPVTTPALTTAIISMLTTISVETGGNVTSNGGAEVIFRGVCWSTNHNPTVMDNKTSEGNGSGTFTSSITGLTPNTTYYVRAYATNRWGTAYGNEISFKSNLVAARLATLTTTVVTSITFINALSGGNITDNGGDNLTDMGICWGTTVNPTINDGKTSYGPGVANFNILIDGLKPATKYYIRAYATNSLGIAYGNELDFTTLPVKPIIFNPGLTYGSVSDIDGNIYKTIQIGTQLWMAENLKTTKYNDGAIIPNVADETEWKNLSTPGYSWYNNDEVSYKATFGALYNWYAIKNDKLCPTGWHLPSNDEWNILITLLGGGIIAGGKVTETGNTHWINLIADATNETGFTGLPGGFRSLSTDFSGFLLIGKSSTWWTIKGSPYQDNASVAVLPSYDDGYEGLQISGYPINKFGGVSVRCVKDN